MSMRQHGPRRALSLWLPRQTWLTLFCRILWYRYVLPNYPKMDELELPSVTIGATMKFMAAEFVPQQPRLGVGLLQMISYVL